MRKKSSNTLQSFARTSDKVLRPRMKYGNIFRNGQFFRFWYIFYFGVLLFYFFFFAVIFAHKHQAFHHSLFNVRLLFAPFHFIHSVSFSSKPMAQ